MRVLVADDDPGSRRLMVSKLEKWGYEIVAVADGNEALAALARQDAPPIVLLDWMMPGKSGLEVCREIRAHTKEPYSYIIIVTSKTDKQSVIHGLEAGADDYVSKPFLPQELKVRLRTGRRIIELQHQLIAAREAIREKAMHDPLTGLLNREAILDFLRRELARAEREGGRFGLVMVDLDHFKRVNDERGHLAGLMLGTQKTIARFSLRSKQTRQKRTIQ